MPSPSTSPRHNRHHAVPPPTRYPRTTYAAIAADRTHSLYAPFATRYQRRNRVVVRVRGGRGGSRSLASWTRSARTRLHATSKKTSRSYRKALTSDNAWRIVIIRERQHKEDNPMTLNVSDTLRTYNRAWTGTVTLADDRSVVVRWTTANGPAIVKDELYTTTTATHQLAIGGWTGAA